MKMETVTGIITLVGAALKTWKAIDAAISAVKDAPVAVRNWTATGRLLQSHLKQMERLMTKKENAVLSPEEVNLFEAIKEHLECFQDDLDTLQAKISSASPKRGFKRRSIAENSLAALKLKLKEDPALEARINRGIQMFQLNVQLLSLRDPVPGTKVQPILDKLLAIPSRPSDDPHNGSDETLQRWRESAQDIATNAALYEVGFSTPTTYWAGFRHLSTVTNPTRWESPFGALGNVSKEELLHKLEISQDLATRLDQAGMPTIASRFQLDAITTARRLHDEHNRAFDMVERVTLEERYIVLLISCQRYDQIYVENAHSRLNELAIEVDAASTNDWYSERRKIGAMYAQLQDHKSAIHFLRTALLDGYLQQDAAEYDVEICETAQLLYDVYGHAGLLTDLDAIKKRVRDVLGKDPTAGLEELRKAISWCRAKGFEASLSDQKLSFESWTNDNGNTPLHEAALDSKIDMEVLQCLMLPELWPLKDSFGDTALLLAVERANYKVVEVLLTVPSLVHVRDKKLQTPLHKCKNKDILKLLIDATKRIPPETEDPVDVDSANGFHWTALHLACQQGRLDLVELLLAHNANANARNITGKTPLYLACSVEINKLKQEAIIKQLVNHGADWEKSMPGGQDPSKLLKTRGFKDSAIRRLSSGDAKERVRRSFDSNATSSTSTRRTNSEASTGSSQTSSGRTAQHLSLPPDINESVFDKDWHLSR
ncbi:hypothetical protein EDB81DRAFT_150255 [Dactylonectria macrodidyma]|uniref:Ankyrin repeat protein n=1 Tax=Dactylonectria macrodidyma TaxID=307937 RepID=A0A9P9FPE2_9HYPO|nr:hypothetical protein EDB81DRAFT_150255 [Dactylonectria macrodidyma]